MARIPDPFYQTPEWKALRKAALERDRFTCTTPGCGQPAKCVDHIVSRRKGGADNLSNLRCLCVMCNAKLMQGPDGERRRESVQITGIDGWPVA